MPSPSRNLGILRPLGGGDPIPLLKDELVVGRRPSCDIRLDFENISGKHCVLKFVRGVWHVRDLKSTNGTFLNRQRIEQDHGVMPDDELRFATHEFSIDYEPAAPSSLMDANQVLEEEIAQASRSLTELAGIDVGPEHRHSRPSRTRRALDEAPRPATPARRERPASRPVDLDTEDPDEPAAPGAIKTTDEDFFKMIESDLDDHH